MKAGASAVRQWPNGQRHTDRVARAARVLTQTRSKTDVQPPRSVQRVATGCPERTRGKQSHNPARSTRLSDPTPAAGLVSPAAETFAAFEWHQSVPQDFLVACATCGSVLGTRQSARELCWRGGGAPDRTRFRSCDLPSLHHPPSPAVSPACQRSARSGAFIQWGRGHRAGG